MDRVSHSQVLANRLVRHHPPVLHHHPTLLPLTPAKASGPARAAHRQVRSQGAIHRLHASADHPAVTAQHPIRLVHRTPSLPDRPTADQVRLPRAHQADRQLANPRIHGQLTCRRRRQAVAQWIPDRPRVPLRASRAF